MPIQDRSEKIGPHTDRYRESHAMTAKLEGWCEALEALWPLGAERPLEFVGRDIRDYQDLSMRNPLFYNNIP